MVFKDSVSLPYLVQCSSGEKSKQFLKLPNMLSNESITYRVSPGLIIANREEFLINWVSKPKSMKHKRNLSENLIIAMGIFALFILTAFYYNFPVSNPENLKFGWEYGNIAEALATGKGFANVFSPESGPTAWMPPFLVLLFAGAFYVFGVKTIAAMWAIMIVKYLALATSLYFLLSAASAPPYGKYKYLLTVLFVLLIYVNRGVYFTSLHDDWLILFLSCWLLWLLAARSHGGSKSNTVSMGIVAFLLPLTSPTLGAAFLLAEAGVMALGISDKSRHRAILAIATLFAASALLWTYRNYRVFGAWIPIKSNIGYDLYQANVLDDDGLVTFSTFENYHPNHPTEFQGEYLKMGERLFTEKYKSLSFSEIRREPIRLLQNIGRRAFSAFVYIHPDEDIKPVNPRYLTARDIEKLAGRKLISTYTPPFVLWTSLNLSGEEFESQICPLALTNEARVIEDWSARREEYERQARRPKAILKSLLLSFIPSLCILLGLVHEKIRRNPLFLYALILYLAYLAPYILISHYRRYQVPMIGLHAMFIFLVTCVMLEKLSRRMRPS